MINVSEVIKNLRKEFSLTQEQFGRAIGGYEGSTISKWESGSRLPDIVTLGEIVNKFGYDLELTLKEKNGLKKDTNFYKEKTYNEIVAMSIEDLTDYIFVTQEPDKIATICDTNVELLDYIPLDNTKRLIADQIPTISRLAIYFILNKKYRTVEKDMADFIEYTKYHLKNTSTIDNNVLNKIEYIQVSTYYSSEGHKDEDFYYFAKISALDKDKNILNVSREDIDGDYTLDSELTSELGDFLYDNDDFTIQLNY